MTGARIIKALKEIFVSLKNTKLTAGLVAAIVLAIPLIVWSQSAGPQIGPSYSSDPPLGKTGAPGEGTCSGCHGGGPGGGSIGVKSSSGTTYHPGTKQHLTVTIADPNADTWGYELTAVQTKKGIVGAGKFKATDKNSDVRAANGKSYGAQINDLSGKTGKVTYKIDWTPPKKNVGKITLYFAANAAGGAGESEYNSSLTLSPK